MYLQHDNLKHYNNKKVNDSEMTLKKDDIKDARVQMCYI